MNKHHSPHIAILLTIAGCLAFQSMGRCATVAREEQKGEDRFLVLENEFARMAVFPAAGAAISEYLDKRTGINFSVGTPKPGTAGQGWTDYTHLHPNDLWDKWLGALPYKAEFKRGDSYQAIVATCETSGLRAEREMRLDNSSAELTVLSKITNVTPQPRGVWMRWHPYMQLDDEQAKTSSIIVAGPHAEIREIPVGGGWDNHFMDVPGYWLAANYLTGNGIWMTFRKEQAPVAATWTDNKFTPHPRRGWFAAELMPQPILLAPGASTELACTYLPFTARDAAENIAPGYVAEADRAAALRFLKLVRANLPAICQHTMAMPVAHTTAAPVPENVFYFSHRRRDRFALLDWGIADAMMSIPAVQAKSIRTRLYARLFEARQQPQVITYVLTITDNQGKQVARQKWSGSVTPDSRILDRKEMIPLQDLADGWYTFTLEIYTGDAAQPVHQYSERRKLVGNERATMVKARAEQAGKPMMERPFVTALRRVELPAERDGIIRIPIGIEEASGTARRQWPMRVGVPFAKGRLPKHATIQLTAPNGKPVPTQTKAMGTWPDGSAKWLLVDFAVDVPANGHVFYTLSTNGKNTNKIAPIIRQDGKQITIDTGARKYQFSSADTGKLLGLFGPHDLWWETGSGRRFEFRPAGEGAGVEIDENGPLRAVVKATGWYYETGNATEKPIARGELRAEFYRGQRFYRLYHTVTYAGNPWQDTLGGFGIRFSFSGTSHQASVELDGKVVSHPGKLSLFQVDEDLAVAKSGSEIAATGRRASGAASLEREGGAISVYHRDLWRLHPKAIEADAAAGTFTVNYWPREAGDMDWRPREDAWISDSASINTLAVGVSRTHEFIIEENAKEPLTETARLFDEPVLAVVPPRYLCATDALLHLQPYDPECMPGLERQISETFDSYFLNQELHGWYGEWKYGSMPNLYLPEETRWADFGRYQYILNEQDICHVPWLAFLRSGDRKYFKFAEANTKHLLEVGTIRLEPVWPQTVGMSHRHQVPIWLGAGDYGHSMLDPFLELYHVTGYTPAWEASERMARGMAEQRDGSWRYISNPIAGLSRMYLETQLPYYKEQADRLWRELCAPDRNEWWLIDHGNRMALYYSQLNDECQRLWNEWTDSKPDRFQGLDVLAAQYRRTGDIKYAQAALKHFHEYQRQAQEYDPERQDALRWSIGTHTQHVLVHIREMCYASTALADAQAREPKPTK